MGVLSVQLVVPFMDLVTPEGTAPPKARTLPKVMVAAEVPLPPNAIPLGSELKVSVRDDAFADGTERSASARTMAIIQKWLGILRDGDKRTVAPCPILF